MRLVITVVVENNVSDALICAPPGTPEQVRIISPARSVIPSERSKAGTADVEQFICWAWAAKAAAKKVEIFKK